MNSGPGKNSVVVISGIARGIGKALAIELAQKGATICGIDIREDELQALATKFNQTNTSHFLQKIDITDAAACQKFADQVIEKFKRVDMVVNSAGITHIAPAEQTQNTDFDRVIKINLLGTIYFTQSFLHELIKSKGCVVGISSVAGYSPLYYRTAYAASKHGVWGYLATLHTEMKDKNVHVMTVCPSYVNTLLQENQQQFFSNQTQETLTPQFVAKAIIEGAEKRKKLLFIGKTAQRAYWLHKFWPNLYEKIMVSKTRMK
jgi:short-subunit dehydrogenase